MLLTGLQPSHLLIVNEFTVPLVPIFVVSTKEMSIRSHKGEKKKKEETRYSASFSLEIGVRELDDSVLERLKIERTRLSG